MDSGAMNAITAALAHRAMRVARFEFDYMAQRRSGGSRRPPPRAERLTGEYLNAVGELSAGPSLFIGGKSMGGRVASMVADELYRNDAIAGLVCLGYPFHPPSRPDSPRTEHLAKLATPTLICQGTRDPFGTRAEVEEYLLSDTITIEWIEDGDHDFKPTRSSGRSTADNMAAIAERVARWTQFVAGRHHS